MVCDTPPLKLLFVGTFRVKSPTLTESGVTLVDVIVLQLATPSLFDTRTLSFLIVLLSRNVKLFVKTFVKNEFPSLAEKTYPEMFGTAEPITREPLFVCDADVLFKGASILHPG